MGKAEALRLAVTQAADALLAVAIAPACASCRRVLDTPTAGPVCAACWEGVTPVSPPVCAVCGDPLPSWRVVTRDEGTCARCRRARPAFDRAFAPGEYEGTLRAIIHAFKYEGRRSLAGPLGTMMRDAAEDVLCGADLVVPVPLHPWRRLRRGFNQAAELARRLDVPVAHALWRRRATAPQSGLRPAQRRRNVRRAFMLSPLAPDLRGRCVVLIDDVKTTGATLDACARVLKAAGAREVRALTAARAAPRG
jgi:ComF family protein